MGLRFNNGRLGWGLRFNEGCGKSVVKLGKETRAAERKMRPPGAAGRLAKRFEAMDRKWEALERNWEVSPKALQGIQQGGLKDGNS